MCLTMPTRRGQRRDGDALDGILQALNSAQAVGVEAEFCNACRRWVVYAWERGKEAAQHR